MSRLDARGARTDLAEFWQEYRRSFEKLSTTFVNAVEGDDQVALEWTTAATLPDGKPVEYSGVTVLDSSASRAATARLAAQRSADCQRRHGAGVRAWAARRQFSNTLNSGKIVVRW